MKDAYLMNPEETEEYLENPGTRRRRRRKGRKARRSRKSGRKHNWGFNKPKARRRRRRRNPGKSSFKFHRGSLYRAPGSGRFTKARTTRPLSRAGGGGWGGNRGRKHSRRRGRRRNPEGLGGVIQSTGGVAPFRIPLPGIIGTLSNNVVQAVASGAVFFTGYFSAGAMVDYIVSPADAARYAAAGDWRAKWARPLLFGALAGLVGTGVAFVATKLKFKNAGLIAAISAAGPGVRAFGGFMAAILPQGATETGFLADAKRAAVGLSDYLTIGGDDDDGMSDYLQIGEGEAMGDDDDMGDVYSAGQDNDLANTVNAAVGDIDDDEGFSGNGDENF